MKDVITNAAEITILKTDANATLKTGGGPVSVGAAVTIASKGEPFKVHKLKADVWQETTGKPLPKKVAGMEGLRHVADAIRHCNYINWVRVMASDARFPSLTVVSNGDQTCTPAITSTQTATITIGGTPEIGDIFTATLEGVPFSFTVTAVEDTNAKIATALAAVIDASADYTAVALNEVITVTKATAGSFTIAGATTNVAAGVDDQTCTVAITSTQVATLTLAGVMGAGGTFTASLNGVSYTYVIQTGDDLSDAAAALAAMVDANAAYIATSLNGVLTITKAAAGSFTIAGATTPGGAIAADAHAYGTALSLGAGACLQIWPIDGDPSVNRGIKITNVVNLLTEPWAINTAYKVNDVLPVTGGRLICITNVTGGTEPTMAVPGAKWKVYNGQYDGRFNITFYDTTTAGVSYVLEGPYLVGLNPDDKDDTGRPAYVETVMEQQSKRFRCNFDESLTWSQVVSELRSIQALGLVSFTGGTNGGTPTTEDWNRAWDLLRNETYQVNHMFAAGNYEADVLANCIDIANKRRCSFDFDVSPNYTPSQAEAWVLGLGLESNNAGITYCPVSANDPFYGGKTVWGASGEAVAAYAKGEKTFTGSFPGVHYAPAGIYRAVLGRTGCVPLHEDAIDRDAFNDARINPIVADQNGLAVIDDSLTLWFKQDYLRFKHVVNIDNYLAWRMLEAFAYAKHEPDGLSKRKLTKLGKEILNDAVTAEALVKPRDPADGTEPYILTVEQVEIDLWLVQYDYCPTGSARRIAGQPRLIK